ncbi:MAG TPA: PAS domain S-box protein [Vicinamibacterales bacterium]|nr:PAS domain S-box protein [Vicinamibacterales bacterium]
MPANRGSKRSAPQRGKRKGAGVLPFSSSQSQPNSALEEDSQDLRLEAERWLDRLAAIEETQDRYIAFYDSAPVGLMALDKRGLILELNQKAAEVLGTSREQLEGKPFLVMVDRPFATTLLTHLTRSAKAAAATQLSLRGSPPKPVELQSRPVWLPGFKGLVLITAIGDISERRKSEQTLRRSERRYREIVETAHEGVCIVDATNTIVFANRRLGILLGCLAADIVGHSAYELVADDEVDAARRAFDARDTGSGGQMETRLRRLDGSTVWTNVSTALTHDENGSFTGMIRMYTDVTVRHELAEARDVLMRQLVDAQERERQRVARELHDQMGQHIVGLSLGLARLAAATSHVEDVQPLIFDLRRLADLLGRDVHTLALELRPSALDHLGLCVALSSYAEEIAQRTKIEMDVHCDPIDDLQLDPAVQTGIYRIAQEALTNVIKHADARRASVILERKGKVLQLIVEDDGQGFTPTHVGKTPDSKLGLAGMRERATLLRGTLTIESSPGSGTTVYARIPIFESEADPHEQSSTVAR